MKKLAYNKGFSLVELSVVLVVVALIISGGLITASSLVSTKSLDTTKERLEKIEIALEAFVKTNGYLPCVARRDLAITDANFGAEVSPCTTAVSGTTLNGTVHTGMLPVKALGLPKSMASDGYNRRFNYSVSTNLATSAANYNGNDGSISIEDGSSNSLITPSGEGAYFVYSTGDDKLGGHEYSSGSVIACSGGTANDRENCDENDTLFIEMPFNPEQGATDHFDDIVLWKTKELIPQDNFTNTFIGIHLEYEDTDSVPGTATEAIANIVAINLDTGYLGTSFGPSNPASSDTDFSLTIPAGVSLVRITDVGRIPDDSSTDSAGYCRLDVTTDATANSFHVSNFKDNTTGTAYYFKKYEIEIPFDPSTSDTLRMTCLKGPKTSSINSHFMMQVIACEVGCDMIR